MDTDFQSFIDEVILKNDIVDIISEYTTLKRTGNNMMGLCPLHNDKKSPSLSVSPDKQIFHCFGCGAGGNVIHYIQAQMNLDFMDSLRYLAERAHLEMPTRRGGDRQKSLSNSKKRERIYQVNAESARYFHESLSSPIGSVGLKYLHDRDISNKTIKKFGIGYAPEGWSNLLNYLQEKGYTENDMHEAGVVKKRDNGTFYDAFYDGRIIFPIIDVRGNVIGFGGRVIKTETDAPKYWNTPETLVFKKKENLFGLNLAKDSKMDKLLIMEGYMDVISLYQNGFPNAVASLGTAFTPEQARLVKRYAARAVLCYDNDEAGKKATIRSGDILTEAGVKVRVLSVTDGKDPDEFIRTKGSELFGVLIEKANTFIDYKIESAKAKYDLSNIEDQIDFVDEASKILAEIKNLAQRDLYIARVSEQLKINPDSLKTGVNNIEHKQNKLARRREEVKIQRENQKRSRSVGLTHKDRELYNAERMILGLMTDEHILKHVLESELRPEDFIQSGIFTKLAGFIFDRYNNQKSIDEMDLLNLFPEDEVGQVSDILINNKNIEDRFEAVKLPLQVMLAAKRERIEQEIMKSGDDEAIMKLFMQRKSFEEKRKENNSGGNI